MSRNDADRDRIFGLTAVQLGLLVRDELDQATREAAESPGSTIGDVLVARGTLTQGDRAAIEGIVEARMRRHGGDPTASLAAITAESGPGLGSTKPLPAATDRGTDDEDAAAFAASGERAGDESRTGGGVRYQRVRLHARGGLGVVYVARDSELNRDVALKEIQTPYADDPSSRSRFLIEAEVTGGLEHPGIVPVYGLGRDATGRPYYAMRFIRGDSLKDAIGRFHRDEATLRDPGARSLALRKLLRRFLDVCNAIDYAHSRGVLHRDLKPDNIMVGKYGETLVVDWGLAKATGRSGEGEGEAHPEGPIRPASVSGDDATAAGSMIGTPAYMPPEQASGRIDLLGPSSDVYSLGATLHALLTGKAPVSGKDLKEVVRKVQSGEIARPRGASPWVDPALEAICLKAMALRPEDRYPNARVLAEDIERWLADEPVTAHREPWTRRVRRWARKHRTAVATTAAGALVATILLGGIATVTAIQTRRTDAAALAILDKANGLAIEARATSDPARWAAAIAEARTAEARLDSGRGSARLRREVDATLASLQLGAQALRETLQAEARDRRMLEVLDEARLLKANVKGNFIDYESMKDAFRQAFRSYGIDIFMLAEDEAAGRVQSSRIAERLVAVLDEWAWFESNKATQTKLRAIAASADAEGWSIAIRSMIARKDAAGLKALLRDPALLKKNEPRIRLIIKVLEQLDSKSALGLLERLRSEDPSDFWYNHDLACAYSLASPPRLDQAIRFYSAAVALRPTSPITQLNLGTALNDHGDKAGSIAAFRQAIRLNPNFASAHSNLGVALLGQGDTPGAIAALRQAIRLKPDDAFVCFNLGNALRAQGDNPVAIALYRKTVRVMPDFAPAHWNLVLTLRSDGQYQESVAALRRGREMGIWKPDSRDVPAKWVEELERYVQLEPKLADFLAGKIKPKDAEEQLILASLCYENSFYATSARFAAEGFAANAGLADDLALGHRYNAACSASLAGSGGGKDDPKPDDAARTALRQKARAWLRADLTAWTKRLDEGIPAAAPTIVQKLTHWKSDADLAGIRDEAALAKLADAEREAFRALWADVESLRAKAEAKVKGGAAK